MGVFVLGVQCVAGVSTDVILWIIVRLMENYGIQQVEATTAITGSGCAGKTRLDTGKQEVAAQRDDRGRGE